MTPAPTRAASAGVAAVVIAVVPLILVSKPADEPPPTTDEVSVDLEAGAGADDPYAVAFTGPSPAPDGETRLRDTSGLHTATVDAAQADCEADSERTVFPDGDATWCLRLLAVPAGHELVGTVSNDEGDEVTLTVRRKADFLGLPLATLLLGLLAGLLVALSPRLLRGLVRRLVLLRLIDENEKGPAERRIEGLRQWVDDRQDRGESRETLIAAVHRVTDSGPEIAQRARADLKESLAAHEAMKPHKLLVAAGEKATDPVMRMSDFYADGEERSSHPIDEWAAAVRRLSAIRVELDGERRRYDSISPEHQHPARQALLKAEERYKDLEKPAELPQIDARLDEVRDAIDDGLARSRAVRGAGPMGTGWVPAVRTAPRGPLESLVSLVWRSQGLGSRIWIARGLTLLVLVIVLTYAFVSIKQAAFDADPLFADGSDYLTLFSAALASGAGATVLAHIGYWRPVAGEDEEA